MVQLYITFFLLFYLTLFMFYFFALSFPFFFLLLFLPMASSFSYPFFFFFLYHGVIFLLFPLLLLLFDSVLSPLLFVFIPWRHLSLIPSSYSFYTMASSFSYTPFLLLSDGVLSPLLIIPLRYLCFILPSYYYTISVLFFLSYYYSMV